MAYLAVNKDGKEVRFDGKYRPFRWEGKWYQPSDNSECVDGRNIRPKHQLHCRQGSNATRMRGSYNSNTIKTH